ncbi:hypothetical protein G6F50_014909 [Rhizopus delemar]|uniref:Uncharacterized protein n=1 Tax=Rhizopus delemar TaxID=936053 RepID=A0A9P7C5X0_9FUNG|nr:hypothetical protein G6F50_014909 [Rhizopus delemar]
MTTAWSNSVRPTECSMACYPWIRRACRGTACTSCRCRTGTGRCGRPSATRCVPAVRHRPIPTGPGLRRSPSDGIARSAHAAGRLRLRPARPVPTTARAPSSARGRRRRGCGPACPRTVRRLRACIPAWGSSAHSRADGCPDAGLRRSGWFLSPASRSAADAAASRLPAPSAAPARPTALPQIPAARTW